PAAKCDVKNRIQSDACAVQCFTEGRRVRVVIDANGQSAERLQPVAQFEIRPAFDLMRATNLAGFPIHRSAETDPDGRRFRGWNQLRQRRLDVFADTRATLGLVNRNSAPLEDLRRRIASYDLLFLAAAFKDA